MLHGIRGALALEYHVQQMMATCERFFTVIACWRILSMEKGSSVSNPWMLVVDMQEDSELGASRRRFHSSSGRTTLCEAHNRNGRFNTSDDTGTDSEIATAGELLPTTAVSVDCADRTSTANISDDRLLEAAKQGDRLAFSELSARYRGLVYQRIFRLVQSPEDAEDMLQEALLQAFIHLGRFRGEARFSTWLTRIGINCALQLLRKKRRCQETCFNRSQENGESREVDCPDPAPNPEQVYAQVQARRLVSLAVQRLPRNCQRLVCEHHEEGRTIADVARSLGISVGSAKARLYRARLTLLSLLKKGEVVQMRRRPRNRLDFGSAACLQVQREPEYN
jgi:RNA polymerase sigma-70 factor (ECF subfamily)